MPARNTIEIAVQAVDKATDILKGINGTVESLSATLTNVGANMTAIGAPFLGLAVKAFAVWDELDDAVAQTDAVLKSTAGSAGMMKQELLQLASAMQDTSTFTRAQVLQGENLLLTFTNIGSKVFPRATQSLIDMATAMGTDAKSQAIQLGKALNDPVQGISALTRVGVTFTEEQKKMIASMVEMGDVAGAQGVILAELEKEFGGSAMAQVDGLVLAGHALNDLFQIIGAAVADVLFPILEVITPVIQGFAEQINTMLENGDNTIGIIIAIGAAFAILGPLIAGAGLALGVITGLLSGPLLPIMLVVGALVLLADHFNISFEQIKVYFNVFILYVQYYIQGIITEIERVITNIKAWADAHPQLMTAILLIIGVIAAATLATGLWSLATGVLVGLLGLLFSPVILLALAIGALLYAIEELYPGGISGVLRDAGTAAQQLGYILQYSLGAAVNWIRNRFADLQVMLFDTLLSILQFAKEVVNNPLLQAINPMLKGVAEQLNANFNQIKAGLILAKHMAQQQTNQAFVPPTPPGFSGGGNQGGGASFSGPGGGSSEGLEDKITRLIDLAQNPIQINFNGTGGPANQQEADETGYMVVNALKAKGV